GSQLGALSPSARGRCGVARSSEGARNGAPAVWLPAPEAAAGPRGDADEPQEAAPAVYRGTAAGASPRWPQAGAWHTRADDAAAGAEPALVAGFCRRHADRWAAVPDPRRGG